MLAFVFPGQGAQSVGMGQALAERYACAKQTFEQADTALGYSISKICFDGPEDKLKLTENSQPAILATSIAALRVVQQETDLVPEVVAGHSLGEYSALVCAGTLTFEDAVQLVHRRGTYMQQAVPAGVGAMAALIGLDEATAEALCAEAAQGDILSPANYNGGKQVVVAGAAPAVSRVVDLAKQRKLRAVPLKVSAPFHCELMAPAAERLAEAIAEIKVDDATIPVVANVNAEPQQSGERIRELLVKQVTASVRWEASVLKMAQMGVERCIELGPGSVLTGLIRRIDRSLSPSSINAPQDIEKLKA